MVFVLLYLVPGYALEQGEPMDGLSQKDIPFFVYNLYKKDGPKKYQLKLPVALETQGLWGPVPQDNPVATHFWEEYKDTGMKKAIEWNPNAGREYDTPFIRVTAMQTVGTPVRIKLIAPKPEEITLPLTGEAGDSRIRYRVIKRIFNVDIVNREGDMTLDKNKEKIKLIENKDTLEICWTPSFVEKKRGPKLTAPIVIEISLSYQVHKDLIINGKINTGLSQPLGWIEKRVAWIAMPVCGQEFGENDEPIACPTNIADGPAWKEYSLGPVSLQVPDNWENNIEGDNGKFELGDGLAGIIVVRKEGGEEQLKHMKELKETARVIDGLNAVEYTGLVKDGTVKAKMILFKDKPSDGKALTIVTALKDDKYADILEASLDTLTIDNGKAEPPGMDALPPPHIPELSELGNGKYSYTPENISQKEYVQADPVDNKTEVQKPAVTQLPGHPAVSTSSSTGSLKLKKLKGFSDFVGRNETLQGNGSPDSQLRLEIKAENKTITSLILRKSDTKKTIWDTTSGNSTWLICVTKKNKPVNKADGTLWYTLGSEKEKLDLWLQDNHTIAAGKKKLELIISFENNESLIIPMER